MKIKKSHLKKTHNVKFVLTKKRAQLNEVTNTQIFKKSYFGSVYVNKELLEQSSK